MNVGEKLGPLTFIGVPGKSPGEVAFHWPERSLLVVGDAVIGNPPGHCALRREKVMDDPARLRQSVSKLLDLESDALLFGDGASILHDAKLRLKELLPPFQVCEPWHRGGGSTRNQTLQRLRVRSVNDIAAASRAYSDGGWKPGLRQLLNSSLQLAPIASGNRSLGTGLSILNPPCK